MTPYLFYSVSDDITRHNDWLVLAESYGPSNGLVFDARIPLKLNDKNSIGASQVESIPSQPTSANIPCQSLIDVPVGTCACGHDKNRLGRILGKLVKLLLAFR